MTHPLDVVRTRLAVSPGQGPWDVWRGLLSKHGFRGAYAGVVSPVLSTGVWKGVTIGTQRRVLDVLEGNGASHTTNVFLASVAGGSLGAIVITPTEIVKTRAQCSGWSIFRELKAATEVSRRELWRTAKVLQARDGFGTGCFLGSYTVLSRAAEDRGLDRSQRAMAAGAVAGPFGWCSTYPLEILRIQQQQVKGLPESPVRAARVLIHQNGLNPLFWWRGCGTCCCRSFFQIPLTMLLFENIVAAAYQTK